MTQRALIIDDNSDNLGVLAELLSQEGFESVQINDPVRLPPVLDGNPHFDIIFLDLELPHLNGFEVLEELKLHHALQQVPVVAYTVHVSEINSARQQGFHSFLTKPLDADTFPEQLATILRGERVWTRG